MGANTSHHLPDHGLVDIIIASERDRDAASVIQEALERCGIRAFVDDTVSSSRYSRDPIAMYDVPVGVVVVTRGFVCSAEGMDTLYQLLERTKRPGASKYPFVLIPVFYGVSPADCADLLTRVYSDPSTWARDPGHLPIQDMPTRATRIKWARWAKQLTVTSGMKPEQADPVLETFASRIAEEAQRHLILAGKLRRPPGVSKAALQVPALGAIVGQASSKQR